MMININIANFEPENTRKYNKENVACLYVKTPWKALCKRDWIIGTRNHFKVNCGYVVCHALINKAVIGFLLQNFPMQVLKKFVSGVRSVNVF